MVIPVVSPGRQFGPGVAVVSRLVSLQPLVVLQAPTAPPVHVVSLAPAPADRVGGEVLPQPPH